MNAFHAADAGGANREAAMTGEELR